MEEIDGAPSLLSEREMGGVIMVILSYFGFFRRERRGEREAISPLLSL